MPYFSSRVYALGWSKAVTLVKLSPDKEKGGGKQGVRTE
jgi:hypothetical protein